MADSGVRLEVRVSGSYVLSYGKKRLKALMRRAGAEVAAVARALIRRSAGGGREYRGSGGGRYRGGYKPGHYTASAPGQSPVSVTGTLARSIKVRPFRSGEGVAVRDAAFYALFLEKGARGGGRKGSKAGRERVLLPRPFLTAALEQREASIAQRIKDSIVNDIEFKRVK
jgi:hypothetical protein